MGSSCLSYIYERYYIYLQQTEMLAKHSDDMLLEQLNDISFDVKLTHRQDISLDTSPLRI